MRIKAKMENLSQTFLLRTAVVEILHVEYKYQNTKYQIVEMPKVKIRKVY